MVFTLFIVDYLCYGQSLCKDFINWHIAYCTIAPFVFVGGVAAVFLKEPDSASQNKETSNLPIFKRFILHPITEISKVNGWVLILCFAGLYRVCDAFIAPMINPFLLVFCCVMLSVLMFIVFVVGFLIDFESKACLDFLGLQ